MSTALFGWRVHARSLFAILCTVLGADDPSYSFDMLTSEREREKLLLNQGFCVYRVYGDVYTRAVTMRDISTLYSMLPGFGVQGGGLRTSVGSVSSGGAYPAGVEVALRRGVVVGGYRAWS